MDDSQGHVHTAHITVLTSVIRCLNKQLPKMEWKKNLYLTVIWSVWHYTDFWQQRQNKIFFSFFFFFFFVLNVQFSVAVICLKLINPFFSFKPYWFQPRNKRSKRKKNAIKSNQSPKIQPSFFLASNEKLQKHVKYFSFFYSEVLLKLQKLASVRLRGEKKKKKLNKRQYVPTLLLKSVWLSFPKAPLKKASLTH